MEYNNIHSDDPGIKKINKFFGLLAFIPLFGWILPLYLKKEEVFCQDTAKLGFIYMFLFFIVIIILNCTNIFLAREWREIRLVNIILIYITYFFYAIICLGSAFASIQGRIIEFPYISKFTKLIRLYKEN